MVSSAEKVDDLKSGNDGDNGLAVSSSTTVVSFEKRLGRWTLIDSEISGPMQFKSGTLELSRATTRKEEEEYDDNNNKLECDYRSTLNSSGHSPSSPALPSRHLRNTTSTRLDMTRVL